MYECLNRFTTAVKDSFKTLSKNDEDALITDIAGGEYPISSDLYRRYSDNLRKAVDAVPMDDTDLQAQWHANVSRFAAYKAFHATQGIRSAVREDGDIERGRAKLHAYNRYQAAEYNTTVTRARTGKQWLHFNEPDNLRLFPNMQWIPSRSADPREEHMPFYNRIWPKDDPFWQHNQPGTLWNCKCDWQQTDEPPTAGNPANTIAAPGLTGNPAATGEIFSDTAPYIRRAPKHIDIGDATRKEFPSLQSLLDVDMKKYRLDYYNLDGGFLQTSRERIKEGQMNKQETEKFGKEYSMCKNLASNNFNVTYRESVQGSYDVTVNGVPAELKKVDSSKQIYRHARKAFEEQGAEAVVIEIKTLDAEAWQQLNKIKLKGWKCYFFTSSDKTIRQP